jgi:putative ABC transport system permease protein
MLKNNLVLFARKVVRRKAFAAINIVGLSVSFTGALLIYLYVSNELSFDRFHRNSDRIYRMYTAQSSPGERLYEYSDTPITLGPLLAQDFDGVEAATRLVSMTSSVLIRVGGQSFNEPNIYEADSSFFHVFSPELIAGSSTALNQPHTVVLPKSAAERYFGDAHKAIGKEWIISLHGEGSYTVEAVVADLPSNSTFRFNALMSIDYANENLEAGNWLSSWPQTYVLLEANADVSTIQEKLRQATERILDPVYAERFGRSYQETKKLGGMQEYRFQPLTNVHLHSSHMGEAGSILYVYIFVGIGVMLVSIAAFNYINLSTARSAWEAKSAGIRKVLGATGGQLYRQFITESVMVNMIAAVGGLLIGELLLAWRSPFLTMFIPAQSIPLGVVGGVIAFAFVLGVISGSAPARLLGTFQPTQVLKGQLAHGTKGNGLRQILVTAQFVVSIALIMCTLVIGRQLSYMQQASLGFDKEHLLVIKNIATLGDHQDTFKESIRSESFVVNSSLCYGVVGKPENFAAFTPVELIDQKREDVVIGIPVFITDNDYLETLGVKILMGHNFPDGLDRKNQQIILNREALRSIGWQDRKEQDLIGKMIDVNGNRYELAAIVDDYHYQSLHRKLSPLAILSHYYQGYENLMVRLKPGSIAQAIQSIQKHWEQVSAGVPFTYTFIDEVMDRLYSAEQNLGLLFMSFACLAIFVGCLGLLGLAMFAAERSVKEIGIRKVLGASVLGIVVRLSRSMISLVLVAFVLATPIAWYAMDRWLENFAYRQPMGISVFVIAGGLTLVVTLLTISYQATKAAIANPVDSLRSE